ncbi:hypothetical protein [Streptomyces sp. NPDC002851]
MRLTSDLLAHVKAVPELRRAVRDRLGTVCLEVELLVSELLANVVHHVGEGAPVTVQASRTRVEVSDVAPDALRSAAPGPARKRLDERRTPKVVLPEGSCFDARNPRKKIS